MSRIPSRRGSRRNEDYPKYSKYPKKERDIDSLIRQKNKEIKQLREQVDEQNQKIDSQESDIDFLKTRIAELEEEVRQLEQELIETRKKLTDVEVTVSSLQENPNILIIGEVCRKFQANLYQYVFPSDYFSADYNYKMAKLEKDIEKTKNEPDKVKARKLWKQLKRKEHPEKFQKLVEELQQLRNRTAHPKIANLDVTDVLKAAEEVNEQGGFGFLKHTEFNFSHVKELIEMWGRIDGYIKDPKTSTSA